MRGIWEFIYLLDILIDYNALCANEQFVLNSVVARLEQADPPSKECQLEPYFRKVIIEWNAPEGVICKNVLFLSLCTLWSVTILYCNTRFGFKLMFSKVELISRTAWLNLRSPVRIISLNSKKDKGCVRKCLQETNLNENFECQ